MTRGTGRRAAWGAGTAATFVALPLVALTVLGHPAEAASDRDARAPVPGVEVVRWVVRDADGNVAARGATATLPGHPAVRGAPAATRTRVATATKGQGVVVRTVAGGAAAPAVTARR